MTTATVKSVVERFLKSELPEVLVLKGSWGIGKTYIWHLLAKSFRQHIKLANYSYVSLFGVSSIQELRLAVFAKTIPTRLIGEKLSTDTINKEWLSLATSGLRRLLGKAQKISEAVPYAKEVSIGLETIAPHLIGPTLICLDDFERLSSQVPADEVLGFVSSLKEEKQCKVVLIFNEEKLAGSETSYKRYREKLVDIEILFAPSAEEAADIVFKAESPWSKDAKRHTVALGIKNIRMLRKIDRLAALIYEPLRDLHPQVLFQGIHTLTVLCWIYYEPEDQKPSMDFVRTFNSFSHAFRRTVRQQNNQQQEAEDPRHEKWEKLLDDYGFKRADELDLALIKVVECGHIEETGLSEAAQALDRQHRATELEQSFTKAWKLFHNTFENNQDLLVATLRDSFKQSVRHINPLNLNGTVQLLRELGQDAIAEELIDFYLVERAGEPGLFDLAEYPFARDITDASVRAKFTARHQANNPPPSLEAVAQKATEGGGWSNPALQTMDQTAEDDFYQLFKKDHGDKLHTLVKAFLDVGTVAGHEEAGRRVRRALEKIGTESELNAIRVRRYLRTTGPDRA